MASTHILLVGKIVAGETHYHVSPLPVEEPPTFDVCPPLRSVDDEDSAGKAPKTRDQRAEESAALYDNARYYEWLKAEREDYEEYLRDIEWLRLGC